jgi:hypothetical protein
MRGLDPRIHLFLKDELPGQARQLQEENRERKKRCPIST